jgi:anti-anti-sigma regulatory factor
MFKTGDITLAQVTGMGREVRDFISKGSGRSCIFDLSAAERVDSSGLNLIANIQKILHASGLTCHLFGVTPAVRETIREAGYETVLQIVERCEDIPGWARDEGPLPDGYLKYTSAEGEYRRLECSCPVCSSRDVIGYLTDDRDLRWRWTGDAFLPGCRRGGTDTAVDLFAMQPVICMSCFMCSTDIRHFDMHDNDAVAVESALDGTAAAALSKGRKKRREIMNIGKTIGDIFFQMPRSDEAFSLAYLLAAECAHAIKARKGAVCPFTIGKHFYFAAARALHERRTDAVSSARAWLTQALQSKQPYSPLQTAQAYFMLIRVSHECGKGKEAVALYEKLKKLCSNTSPRPDSGISDPHFWLAGAHFAMGPVS